MRRFTDCDPTNFWNWDEFSSYLQALVSLFTVLSVLSLVYMGRAWFVEGLGTAALGVEALLAVPQAYRNYKKQSVAGLRYV